MFSTIDSGAVCGLQAYLVRVEVDLAGGLPSFQMVGSLGSEVRESRERVCVAMKNSGFQIPPCHITVNLAPAGRRKDGTAFDLPIAVGLLKDMELLTEEAVRDTLFLGELGLNGEIKRVKGVLPIVREAADKGIGRVIVPRENALEAAVIPGITVWGVGELGELIMALLHPDAENEKIYKPRIRAEELLQKKKADRRGDFKEVSGQESARRGAMIAAAGFHNLLMMGPPGVGKSMIAGRIPGILPSLTLEESLEVTSIYSVAGLLTPEQALITERPFYAPHHTVTAAALIGGGNAYPRPGMVSLAHRGRVVFGRASGISADGAGQYAATVGRTQGTDCQGVGSGNFSVGFYAGGCHEPLSLRILSGSEQMPLHTAADRKISRKSIGTAIGPY